jgi:lipopolysaccharide export system protein LptA
MTPNAIRATFAAAFLSAFLAASAPCALAQPGSSNAPNALQGFQQNRGQPVKIEASRLEVRDKDKMATFTGNVKVVQGDTTLRCKTLVVFYEQQNKDGQQAQAAAKSMPAAKPGPGGSSQISKLEASGGVTVVQKEQTATGDRALFDMKANTVTLLGNVLVSQGTNVMQGEKLVVDLTTGVSRVDAGKAPVRMLLHQSPPGEKGGGGSGPKFGPPRPSSSKSAN